MPESLRYKRILFKLSGEALLGDQPSGIDPHILSYIASELKEALSLGTQIAMVVGAGNLFRGRQLADCGLARVTGDHMGMLATIINALALRDVFERLNIPTSIFSAISVAGVCPQYDRRLVIDRLEEGKLVLLAGGTGNPLVTTDSAASLRAIELNAELLIKATQVDGIYSADPKHHPEAQRYDHLNYDEVLKKELGVMDLGAFCQCRDYRMPIRVFQLSKPGALGRILRGASEGTLVDGESSPFAG